jgi:uncharacterized cupredoxin-like copper-binding protein
VFVLLGGLGLALALVLLGARMAATPAAAPDLSQPGTADQPREVNVILRDYVFNPTPLYLAPGEVVEFNLINAGLVAHEFVLGDDAVQAAWAAAHAAVTAPAPFATPPPASVPPDRAGVRVLLTTGASTSVIYAVPSAGRLELVCHLPGHVEQGMVGDVVLAVP